MGLTMKQRQAVTKQMALKYERATKKQKGAILDTLTELTGYNRSYAAHLLRSFASKEGYAAGGCLLRMYYGSEFISNHLFRYCTENKITFTRTRPYRKNDNRFVEQKNYSVVRRAVGYRRYDTPSELEVLKDLYAVLRLYTDYFQPSMKLIAKTRNGSKARKKYDKAKTPYRRVLDSDAVPEQAKEELKRVYETLNPVKLGREISRLQDRLDELARSKSHAQEEANLEYIST